MRRPIVDKLEAQRLAKSALARAGLPIAHEALAGVQAGIALETALRTWASGEGYEDKPDNTLGNVLGFLAREKMVTDGEHKQLMTDLLVRNHCAHGRWARLNPGQVTHLIENSLRWCDRLAAQGVIAAPLPMVGGDILLEESAIAPKPSKAVAWAFSKGSFKLNGVAGYALMIQFLILFSISLAAGGLLAVFHLGTAVSGFADLVAGRKPEVSLGLSMATTLTMLVCFWAAALFFRDGLWRLMNVDKTFVSPASRLWTKVEPDRCLLRADDVSGRKVVTLRHITSNCGECGGALRITTNYEGRRARVTAVCTDKPTEHAYRVNASDLTGSFIV